MLQKDYMSVEITYLVFGGECAKKYTHTLKKWNKKTWNFKKLYKKAKN